MNDTIHRFASGIFRNACGRACIPQPFALGRHGMQVTVAFEDEGKVGVELIDSEQTPPPSLKLRKESAPAVRPTCMRQRPFFSF
jgi:hypothetical protein